VTSPAARGRVAVVGAGIVGARTVRELLGPGADGQPTNDGVVLVSRREDRLRELAPVYGTRVATVRADGLPALPDDVGVVVVAREQGAQLAVAEAAVRQGRHVVSVGDDPEDVEALLALTGAARDAGVALVAGVAMAPGLSCLLARHAAAQLDSVDEIHVARDGVAGPACARQRLRALRGGAVDWRDGSYVRRPGFSGRELCWFPDPVGARDCYRAALADPYLLVPAFPRDGSAGGLPSRPGARTVAGPAAPARRGRSGRAPGRGARRRGRCPGDHRPRGLRPTRDRGLGAGRRHGHGRGGGPPPGRLGRGGGRRHRAAARRAGPARGAGRTVPRRFLAPAGFLRIWAQHRRPEGR
jgi:hypothetical protein